MPKRRSGPPPGRSAPPVRGSRPTSPARRRRRKRYNYILYYMLLFLLAMAVGIVLSFTVFFKLETVKVTGRSIYTEYQITSQANLQLGENLFRFDLDEVAAQVLERFPFLDKVTVVRRLPSTIVIEVQPATPVGALYRDDLYLLFSESGKVLQVDSQVLPDGCYVVEGIPSEGLLPGDSLQENATEELRMLRYLLDSVEKVGFTDITQIDLSDVYNMKLVYQDRITVELGSEADMDYKLQFVRHVLENNLEPDAAGTMTISVASKRITFHPADDQGEGSLQAPPVDFGDAEQGEESSSSVPSEDASSSSSASSSVGEEGASGASNSDSGEGELIPPPDGDGADTA